MIHLNHINVTFGRPVLRDAEIRIPRGKVTAITGDSGCGKTTVLYILGMMSSQQDLQYIYDGKAIDLHDRAECRRLAREEFGFLFQDHSLIETLTISENLIQLAALAKRKLTDSEIDSLLKEVDLDPAQKNAYPKQLSGGEQQRAALAGVLARKPRCLFADEPTSALDRTNTQKIIQIFKRLAERGITVVIASHSDAMCDAADCLYHVEDQKIVLDRGSVDDSSTEPESAVRTAPYGLPNLFRYVKKSQKKGKILKGLIVTFCALAIAGFSLTNTVMDTLQNQQRNLLNQISEREIFVLNQEHPTDTILDADGNPVLTDEELEKMHALSGVEEIMPFYEFRSFSLLGNQTGPSAEVIAETSEGERKRSFSLEDAAFPYFVVQPYHTEQKIPAQAEILFDAAKSDPEHAVYLSHDFAEALELENASGSVTLKTQVYVPVRKLHSTMQINHSEENADYDISEATEIEVPVAGILPYEVVNRYSINGNRIIYMPEAEMERIREKCAAKNEETDYSSLAQNGESLLRWMPSACLVFASDYDGINAIKSKLGNLSPKFITRCDYQDTVGMDQMLAGIKSTSTIILTIVVCIIFVLMSAVFISQTLARKREFALLKANGMQEHNLVRMMIVESLWQSMHILLTALLISIVLSVISTQLLLASVSLFSAKTILYVLCSAVLFVLIPTLAGIAVTLRVQPDRILRS